MHGCRLVHGAGPLIVVQQALKWSRAQSSSCVRAISLIMKSLNLCSSYTILHICTYILFRKTPLYILQLSIPDPKSYKTQFQNLPHINPIQYHMTLIRLYVGIPI